ncbi:RNA-guided endonuclease InsQ/TnpB family protein [Mycolicibacterium mageritense]|uniref:RNA-guided endonuclease InsQ/TnpB family protein n=1 Tax=Mycolicibacterium mageritense TaxID=53462 RepID=UPI0011D46005|nr:RNA-guided endonuclease TnpB family protein [Mycolicibacterium mageritense]TXI55762.1 MAG: transposase [Mycolicibacterium mageritense]
MSEGLRAYRFALDLTAAQTASVRQHAGATRWAFNHALAIKLAALQQRQAVIAELVAAGVDEKAAARQAPRIPTKPQIQRELNQAKGDSRTGADGLCPWWWTVSTYAFQSALADADHAWSNWLSSITGQRAGRRVGRPRFKCKNRSRDSFRIHHDVKNPTIRLDTGSRRIIVPRLGSLRTHDSTKRLRRALDRGAVVQSVTISRGGHRWYASILVKATVEGVRPSKAQKRAGTVGVDLGVHTLAALSTGELVANPRHLNASQRRIAAAQRALSRTKKGSNRRVRAARLLGRRHHELAQQRASTLHQLTKKLATGWSVVAIEDLNVAGMTRSARGTLDSPGRNIRAKAGLNRAVLDVSPGEIRRQLTYKTDWYGSQLAICPRFYPSTQTCSACGARAKLTLADRVFHCTACDFGPIDRDLNAARNIAANAVVAPGSGETQNARRADPRRPPQVGPCPRPAVKREDHHHTVVATSVEQSTDLHNARPAEYPLVS